MKPLKRRVVKIEQLLGVKNEPAPAIIFTGKNESITRLNLSGEELFWERQEGETEEAFTDRAISEVLSMKKVPIFFTAAVE